MGRIKVEDIELSGPLKTISDLDGYSELYGLIRLHGTPLGHVRLPVHGGRCTAAVLGSAILEQHAWPMIAELLRIGLLTPAALDDFRFDELLDLVPPRHEGPFPSVTVAVCTRDRPGDLATCLDSVTRLDYPALDLLVVDNAPANGDTEQLVRSRYPRVRYVREDRPGLNWARNRAALEARGEIVAYTDDDVVVDRDWVSNLAEVFVDTPGVMAVTGLVVPLELETEAQVIFENNGGFCRGFQRRWYHLPHGSRFPAWMLGPGLFGTGANMAFRRSLFEEIGFFDPALDVGTVTNGGGDLEMFFRVVKEGHTLVYEPRAFVRHRHRREYADLKRQITNNGGVYSYLVAGVLKYPDEIPSVLGVLLRWIWSWHLRNLLLAFRRKGRLPLDLVLAEMRGCWVGLGRYFKARKIAGRIAKQLGRLVPGAGWNRRGQRSRKPAEAMAVRTIEMTRPLEAVADVAGYARTRVFLSWSGSPRDSVDIANNHHSVSSARLCDVIVERYGLKLLGSLRDVRDDVRWGEAVTGLRRYLGRDVEAEVPHCPSRLPMSVPVSIVVATYDRPDDLRKCLHTLLGQQTERSVEIVVVDNHPTSGLTPPVAAEFPSVKFVGELRPGLSYARNSGITASTGEIVVATDDDVIAPPDWLEKLLKPFARPEVKVVTGNVLPLELETRPQQAFEEYGVGGLSRGFHGFEADGAWFRRTIIRAVPAWELGATANAAFHASIFHHPEIGLMDEALGAGMPSGVGEDTYVFYKVLKAGFTLVYKPSAFVWHKHRSSREAWHRQLFSYSKGILAYQLTTLMRERDYRALVTLGLDLPRWHLSRIKDRLRRRSTYPIRLILLEAAGNLMGPWALWRSRRRVARLGRSDPYVPVAERGPGQTTALQAAKRPVPGTQRASRRA